MLAFYPQLRKGGSSARAAIAPAFKAPTASFLASNPAITIYTSSSAATDPTIKGKISKPHEASDHIQPVSAATAGNDFSASAHPILTSVPTAATPLQIASYHVPIRGSVADRDECSAASAHLAIVPLVGQGFHDLEFAVFEES